MNRASMFTSACVLSAFSWVATCAVPIDILSLMDAKRTGTFVEGVELGSGLTLRDMSGICLVDPFSNTNIDFILSGNGPASQVSSRLTLVSPPSQDWRSDVLIHGGIEIGANQDTSVEIFSNHDWKGDDITFALGSPVSPFTDSSKPNGLTSIPELALQDTILSDTGLLFPAESYFVATSPTESCWENSADTLRPATSVEPWLDGQFDLRAASTDIVEPLACELSFFVDLDDNESSPMLSSSNRDLLRASPRPRTFGDVAEWDWLNPFVGGIYVHPTIDWLSPLTINQFESPQNELIDEKWAMANSMDSFDLDDDLTSLGTSYSVVRDSEPASLPANPPSPIDGPIESPKPILYAARSESGREVVRNALRSEANWRAFGEDKRPQQR